MTARRKSSRAPRTKRSGGRAGAHGRRDPEEARAEIMDAAAKSLSRGAFRELTVEGLMERTSIGRSAFYAYFADRFELAEALLVEIRGEVLTATRAWLFEPEGDPREALCQSVDGLVEVWRALGPRLRAIADAATQNPRLERIYRDVVAFNDQAVANAIRRDQAAGWIDEEVDPDETAAALNQLNLAYLYDRLGRPSRRDLAPLKRTLRAIWLRTLYGQAAR